MFFFLLRCMIKAVAGVVSRQTKRKVRNAKERSIEMWEMQDRRTDGIEQPGRNKQIQGRKTMQPTWGSVFVCVCVLGLRPLCIDACERVCVPAIKSRSCYAEPLWVV